MDKAGLIQLLESGWVSREVLQSALGLRDRNVRQVLSDLNVELSHEGKCILSSGSRKGYHIPSPNCADDIEMARMAEKELESKAISIFERRKAIRGFIKRVDSTPFQDTLF